MSDPMRLPLSPIYPDGWYEQFCEISEMMAASPRYREWQAAQLAERARRERCKQRRARR